MTGSTNCCHGIGAPTPGTSITPLELQLARPRSSPDAYNANDQRFSYRPGTGVVFPHCILEGRHRNPAVPIKAMRCNARMALVILESYLLMTRGLTLFIEAVRNT